jgi:membrane associated rhomboid family serine protease
MNENNNLPSIGQELNSHAIVLGGFLMFMWLLEVFDWLTPGFALDAYGVRPRTILGLRGIAFAPFLHVGFSHLIANSVPFLVLGWFVMMRRVRDFAWVTLLVALVSGAGIWLFGAPNSVHLGASSLIFGYFGFLLLRGYFERSPRSIFFSVIVAILYGGLIWGVLPQANGISWQGHLFGFLGGAWAAYLLADRGDVLLEPADPLSDQIRILGD